MIRVPLACYVKQEEGSFVEVEFVAEYRLAQNSLTFEETRLQHAGISESNTMISSINFHISKSKCTMYTRAEPQMFSCS